jgi:hypothetical protein
VVCLTGDGHDCGQRQCISTYTTGEQREQQD